MSTTPEQLMAHVKAGGQISNGPNCFSRFDGKYLFGCDDPNCCFELVETDAEFLDWISSDAPEWHIVPAARAPDAGKG
jgi:hypothetical protein